jgi:hypothetical protein
MDASPPTPPPRHPGSPLVTRGGGPVDTGAAPPVAPVYCSLDDKAVGITWATAERERAQQLALTYDLQSTLGGATGHTQQQRRCARAACTAASPCFVYMAGALREARLGIRPLESFGELLEGNGAQQLTCRAHWTVPICVVDSSNVRRDA